MRATTSREAGCGAYSPIAFYLASTKGNVPFSPRYKRMTTPFLVHLVDRCLPENDKLYAQNLIKELCKRNDFDLVLSCLRRFVALWGKNRDNIELLFSAGIEASPQPPIRDYLASLGAKPSEITWLPGHETIEQAHLEVLAYGWGTTYPLLRRLEQVTAIIPRGYQNILPWSSSTTSDALILLSKAVKSNNISAIRQIFNLCSRLPLRHYIGDLSFYPGQEQALIEVVKHKEYTSWHRLHGLSNYQIVVGSLGSFIDKLEKLNALKASVSTNQLDVVEHLLNIWNDGDLPLACVFLQALRSYADISILDLLLRHMSAKELTYLIRPNWPHTHIPKIYEKYMSEVYKIKI